MSHARGVRSSSSRRVVSKEINHDRFLSDAGCIVQKDFDMAEYTDPLTNLGIPHVIVLEPGLVIYKIYNDYWYFSRRTTEELRQDLREEVPS
jgi:hypothetical protein